MTLQESVDKARGEVLERLGNRLPPKIGDVQAAKEHNAYMTFLIGEMDKAEAEVRAAAPVINSKSTRKVKQ